MSLTNKCRILPDFCLEKLYPSPVAGIDEAGCGPWAGPVVAGAVIFLHPEKITENDLSFIRDSKQLSFMRREKAFDMLKGMPDVRLGVGQASVDEIDRLNIVQATHLAMQRAVSQLGIIPACALVDGNRKPSLSCPATTVVKGDQISYSIAAASIVAKVTRDRVMADLAKDYPAYGWDKNAGYGTCRHQAALKLQGVTPYHRRSYAPVARLLQTL